MLRNDYTSQTCSIASALEVVGERWSLLIVRNIMLGLRRFDEIQENLGIARNVLQTRLTRLIEQGAIEKRLYQDRPPRYEYRLTEKGLDLWPDDRRADELGRPPRRQPGRPTGAARAPRLWRRDRCAPHLRALWRAALGARLTSPTGTGRERRSSAPAPSPSARPRPSESGTSSSVAPSRAMRERGTINSKPACSARVAHRHIDV